MTSIFSTRAVGEVHPLTLSEQIAERIYLSIVEGEFEFGERIREDSLSKKYQVSRGPIREALRILEKDSVVVIQPHRGAHVTNLTVEDVRDIFSIRKVLISLAIKNISKIDASTYNDWKKRVERMADIASQADGQGEYILNSARIHLDIAAQTNNKRLVEMIRSLARQTFRYTALALNTPKKRKLSVVEWGKIIKKINAEKCDEAAKLAEELIGASCENAVAHLKSQL